MNLGGGARAFQGVLLGVALLLAVALVVRGQYAIGAIVAAYAVLRIGYVVYLRRGGRWAGRAGRGNPIRQMLPELARREFGVAAGVLGVTAAQLREEFEAGASIAEVAARSGVPLDGVVSAVVSDASAEIERARAVGRLTEDGARLAKARLPMWADRLVHRHRRDLRGARA